VGAGGGDRKRFDPTPPLAAHPLLCRLGN